MLRRDGAITIYVRRLGDGGVRFARRSIVATYRIGLSDSQRIVPRATREAVRRTA
jgi:hypothetical protein